jgi:hypothetical protein
MENGLCIKYRKNLRKKEATRETTGCPTDHVWDGITRYETGQTVTTNITTHDGHSPCPHLTLLPLCLCYILRPTPSFCKTPARSSSSSSSLSSKPTQTSIIHDDSSILRALTPRLYPNPNPYPPFPTPRRGPDRDTRTSRPKLGQRPHHRFQHRDRRPRAPLHNSRMDPLPALQTEEAAASHLAEHGSTTADKPLPSSFIKLPSTIPSHCFPQVNIRLPSIPIGLHRSDTVQFYRSA